MTLKTDTYRHTGDAFCLTAGCQWKQDHSNFSPEELHELVVDHVLEQGHQVRQSLLYTAVMKGVHD